MKVLNVISDSDRRGAQIFASDLSRELRLSHPEVMSEVVALAPGAGGNPLDVTILGNRSRGLGTLLRLRQLMSEADVTVAHGSTTGFACAVSGLFTGKFVFRQISDTRFWVNTRFRRIRVRLYLRRAAAVVALCNYDKRELVDYLGIPASKISVIPNGVPIPEDLRADEKRKADIRFHLGIKPNAFVVLYAAALVPEKGLADLISAVATIPQIHLLVAGDGPMREDFISQSEPLRERVSFLGSVSDMEPLYAVSDVVVLPSRGGDSMPAVLIEAGLRGLPTISTPISGIPEIVVDKQTGLIVQSESPEGLASALRDLLSDTEKRRNLGAEATVHCQNRYSIGSVSEQWFSLMKATSERDCKSS